MIASGSVVTYTDPLTRRSVECVVMETVTMWAGTQRRGVAYNVYNPKRGHWTARPKTLRSADA